MKRTLLKEAILDARTVKDTAIANAKIALEETFSPKLREMFAEKIEALDEEEKDEEDLNLEEILAELESLEETEEVTEAEESEVTEEESEVTEAETEETEETEEEFDIENMSEEDLKKFIESIVDEMIETGELEAGDGSGEDTEMDLDMDDLGSEGSEESEEEMINIDELLAEMKDDEESLTEGPGEVIDQFLASGAAGNFAAAAVALGVTTGVAKLLWDAIKGEKKNTTAESENEELEEAYNVINVLKKELNEINLLNAKLLYTNKIFKVKNLSENQKIKVLSTFDKASSVKEVKLVYESLSSSLNEKKKTIKESYGLASKHVNQPEINVPIIPEDKMVARFKKLAGLK